MTSIQNQKINNPCYKCNKVIRTVNGNPMCDIYGYTDFTDGTDRSNCVDYQPLKGTVVSEKQGAIKHDNGKLMISLVPISPLQKLAMVYMVGADKYGKDNWLKGMKWSRIYDAIQRHLMAFWQGEDNDREDGLSHLAHAAWGMFTLMDYDRLHLGTDDRMKQGEQSEL